MMDPRRKIIADMEIERFIEDIAADINKTGVYMHEKYKVEGAWFLGMKKASALNGLEHARKLLLDFRSKIVELKKYRPTKTNPKTARKSEYEEVNSDDDTNTLEINYKSLAILFGVAILPSIWFINMQLFSKQWYQDFVISAMFWCGGVLVLIAIFMFLISSNPLDAIQKLCLYILCLCASAASFLFAIIVGYIILLVVTFGQIIKSNADYNWLAVAIGTVVLLLLTLNYIPAVVRKNLYVIKKKDTIKIKTKATRKSCKSMKTNSAPAAGKMADSSELSSLEIMAAGLMYVAGTDSNSEDAYIVSVFKSSPDILEKSSTYYKTHSYSDFLDSCKTLGVKQQSCLLANMMELAMTDGEFEVAEQDLISQFVETLGVSKKDYAKTMDILILKNMITVFDENIPEPTANSLLPFEMLAVGMMYAAGADSEVSLAENAYIASMFKDDLAVYLEKASVYYKTHSYAEFLESRKTLSVKQCSCLIANMVELAMADDKLTPVKKKILEQFKDTVITDKEYAKIFAVLALKNKISEFTEITP